LWSLRPYAGKRALRATTDRIQGCGRLISLRPKLPAADDEYTPEQRRIVDAQLAEGLADVKAGRAHGPFYTHEEFIASLHKEAKKLNRKEIKRSA